MTTAAKPFREFAGSCSFAKDGFTASCSHGSNLRVRCVSEVKGLQPAHCFDVLVRRLTRANGLLACLAFALGGTTRQQVATLPLAVLQLSRRGDLEPLRNAAVRFVLGCHLPFL